MAHVNLQTLGWTGSAGAVFSLALAIVPLGAARAAALGEIELRSFLGEQFDARIPVSISEGELLEEACFSLARPEADGPAVTRATLTLELEGGSARLRVQSNRPWNEPVANLRVRFFCARTGPVVRDYALLLDPRGAISVPVLDAQPAPRMASPAAAAPSAPTPVAPPPGWLIASSGDTLAGIAKAIYPKSRKLQRAYIAAMRKENTLELHGVNDPLPEGMEIALPDLRNFANSAGAVEAARSPVPSAERSAPAVPAPAKPEKTAAVAPRAQKAAADKPAAAAPSPAPKPTTPVASAARQADGGFRLRLSTGDIDLSRSRGMDDEKRNRLRERQLVLDSDDQVAALLQLRHHLKELETRVAEMQLRLTTSVPPPAPVAAAPIQKPPAAVSPPVVEAPAKPAMAPPPPKPPAVPVEVVKPAEPRPVAPVPAPAAKPVPEAAPAPQAEKPREVAPVKAQPGEPMDEGLPAWLWGVVALLAAAVIWLALRVIAARRSAGEDNLPEPPGPVSELDISGSPSDYKDGLDEEPAPEPELPPERRPARVGEMTMQVAAFRPGREMESDASLVTRVSVGDPDDLRRRYIQERFPELANRTISMSDTDSIVKGARLFYEDGAHSRAIELLTVAIEERGDEVKLWLALFEIYRLDEMNAEFAELAERFRSRHGASKFWKKIQLIGREIDAQNPLYRDDAPGDGVENIRDSVTQRPGTGGFDPLAENWLNAPMDFMTDALASDLRHAVLAEHGVSEADLARNPMPALKNMEVFRVS
jgi:hypothetical protein